MEFTLQPEINFGKSLLQDCILVVDDSDLVLDLVRFALRDLNINIISANGAHQAMERLQECDVKLILTDLSMPKIDGFSFIRQVRALPNYAHIPVVVLTGYDRENAEANCLAAGADAFLQKPFAPHSISGFIQKQLKRACSGAAHRDAARENVARDA